MAVQFEQLDLSGYAKINDTTPSANTTYSSQKIEEILLEAGAVIDDSEASTTKTYSSTHIDETYLKKEGNGSGVSVEYTESDTGSAPASGSMLGNIIGWIIGKCNGIGAIANLVTTAKTNLVAAINECAMEIGNLTELTTDEKTDLVSAINETNAGLTEQNSNKVSGWGDLENVSNPYTPEEDGSIRIYYAPSGNTVATVYATENGKSYFYAGSPGGANLMQYFPAKAGHTYQGQASQPGTIQLAFMPLKKE